jgi:acyl-CoA thioesterase-1
MRIFLILISLLSPWALAQGPIMVFGDSLSAAYGLDEEQGWAYLLQDRLSDSGDEREVINLSVSGETTGGGWARLPDALEVYHPSIVVLELGANDGLRGLSVKRMQRNLTNMVSAAQDSGAQVLMLGMRLPPSYGKRYVEAFEAVFPRVANEQNVELMPFFLEPIALRDELFQDDRLHPTAPAQPILLDEVWRFLEPML